MHAYLTDRLKTVTEALTRTQDLMATLVRQQRELLDYQARLEGAYSELNAALQHATPLDLDPQIEVTLH